MGAFGVVLLVERKHIRIRTALKIIYKGRLNEEEIKILKIESEILRKLNAKTNIVQFNQVNRIGLTNIDV